MVDWQQQGCGSDLDSTSQPCSKPSKVEVWVQDAQSLLSEEALPSSYNLLSLS